MRKIIGIAGRGRSGKSTVAAMLAPVHIAYSFRSLFFRVRGTEEEARRVLNDGEGRVEIAFADPLKHIVMEMYDFSVEQLWGELRDVPDKRYPRTRERHRYEEQHGDTRNPENCPLCGVEVVKWDMREYPLFEAEGPCTDYLTPREALQIVGTEAGRRLYPKTWINPTIYRAQHARDGAVISDVRYLSEAKAVQEAGGEVWFVDRAGAGLKGHFANHSSETGLLAVQQMADQHIVNNGTLDALKAAVEVLR